ncbi:MAG: glycoside hydrolase family 99-like domain-containing protein [Cetobacterium sp.]
MKIIAYHLPQFHSTLENDQWWGKNFTEWNNVKNGKSFFEDHNQPNEPLNDFYYNMLDKQTLRWQNKLSEKYGIYGFCYYHYWFEGRKMLEKPIENLLEWKEIKQNYCLCWANHNWRRTWDGTDELLIRQSYGKKESWRMHFEYLLYFFKDERYIKKDGQPVFLIYDPLSIPECDEMLEYWNELAKDNGIESIYVIESLNNVRNKFLENSKGVVIREPAYSKEMKSSYKIFFDTLKYKLKRITKIYKVYNPIKFYDYDLVWKNLIKNAKTLEIPNKIVYQGSFLNWDNTPRHKTNGSVFRGLTKDKFEINLKKQKEISKKNKSEFLFFNAWNEWGEGMYLEPDKKNGYKYLEVIKKVISGKES